MPKFVEPRPQGARSWARTGQTGRSEARASARTEPKPSPRLPDRRRRRSKVLATGAAVAAVGGLSGLWLYDSVQDRTAVVVLARNIEAGTTISASDLRKVDVAVPPGVATVPATQRAALVGKVARVDLAARSLLVPGAIGDPTPPATGQSLVVLSLPSSRIPASGLRPGQRLVLVSTSDANMLGDPGGAETDGAGTASVATAYAEVVRVGVADPSGTTPVDVAVQAGDGPLWAGLAAGGRVAVLVEPQGQVHR